MKEGLISMTNKEFIRLEIIQKVNSKRLTQLQATAYLSLSAKQIGRLCRRYQEEGPKGLISRKRGAKGNHNLSDELKQNAIKLIWAKYQDFGPTLAQEKLLELDHINLSIGTVRKLMIKNFIWKPSQIKRKVIHQMRERRSKYGELIQIDGSPHAWLENRGPKCTLIVFIDDATSRLLYLKFEEAETTWAYADGVKSSILQYGLPCAYYSDKHNIFRVNRSDALSGDGMTQFNKMIKDLNIALICANSPQAKGRVERSNRVLQDRLVKELRLNSISTIEEANAFLPSFMEKHNQRFAKTPKSPLNAHRELPKDLDLDRIFRLRETRYLSKNLTFQYKNKLYQIKTSRSSYALRKARIDVLENKYREVIVEYKKQKLSYSIYEERSSQAEEVHSKELNSKLDNLLKKKYKPTKRHPWKRPLPSIAINC
jgi:hypothetical protein